MTLYVTGFDIYNSKTKYRRKCRVLNSDEFKEKNKSFDENLVHFLSKKENCNYINAEFVININPRVFVSPKNIAWYIEKEKTGNIMEIFESKLITITSVLRYELSNSKWIQHTNK